MFNAEPPLEKGSLVPDATRDAEAPLQHDFASLWDSRAAPALNALTVGTLGGLDVSGTRRPLRNELRRGIEAIESERYRRGQLRSRTARVATGGREGAS